MSTNAEEAAMSMDEAVSIVEEQIEFRNLSFQEAMSRYDIVGARHDPIEGSYVVLADRPRVSHGEYGGLGFREMAYSSPSPWTAWTREERLPQLRDKQGIRTYYDMKRADGTVRGSLRVLKTPIQAAEWFVKPVTDNPRDVKIAEFIEDNLFNRLNVSWSRFIEDALTMCELGYAPFEKVYTYDERDDKVRLKKLAHRHPLDIREWLYDENGGPDYLVMEPLDISGWQEIIIPIQKLLVFVFEQEGGDLRGTSVLRSAYQHYYYKKCVDEETEIFTQDGWKRYDQIKPGDKTLSINEKTGLSEWDEIQYVKTYPGTHDVVKMESSQFSSITTPNHRWLTRFKGAWRWRTTETLTHDDNIPLVMPCVTLPTNPKYSDEFVELIAWLWTEGTETKHGFRISQSNEVNPNNVNRIRRALGQICPNPIKGVRFNNGHKYWSERVTADRPDMTIFYIGKELSKELWSCLDTHKIVSKDFITSLTRSQLELFVKVSLLGDGCETQLYGGPRVTQENEEQLIALQMACSLLGIATSLKSSKPKGYNRRWILTLRENNFINPRKSASLATSRGCKNGMKITHEQYVGTVWCPKTTNANWLARRNGTVFTTGNTLYSIDAIQKERHGIGVPLIKLPMGFSLQDRKLADELGRNLRTNERAHITIPSNWEVCFAKLEGQPVNCMDSIKHHDKKIMSNVLTPFLDEPTESDKQDMFYKSTRYIAHTISDTINKHCIPELVDMNFMRHGGYPKLMVRRIGEWEDIRTMTFAARNLVGSQMLTPDDPLEEYIRDQLFLPPMDKDTSRNPVQSPTYGDNQGEESNTGTESRQRKLINPTENVKPPKVDGSRQKPEPPVQPPQGNAGTDRSGG